MSGCEIRHGPENYQKDVHMTYLFLFINLPSLIIGAFGFHQLRPEQKICKLLLEVGSWIKQCTMDINHKIQAFQGRVYFYTSVSKHLPTEQSKDSEMAAAMLWHD